VQNSRSEQGDDSQQDNPSLSKVIERNIRTIIQLRLKSDRERNIQGRVADYVTAYAGSMASMCTSRGLPFGYSSTPGDSECILSIPSPMDC